jgi:hypothetical protein
MRGVAPIQQVCISEINQYSLSESSRFGVTAQNLDRYGVALQFRERSLQRGVVAVRLQSRRRSGIPTLPGG